MIHITNKLFKQMKSSHQILFAFIGVFAVVSFWRGIWGLSEIYLFPSNLVLSLWVSLFLGFFLLIGTHRLAKGLVRLS